MQFILYMYKVLNLFIYFRCGDIILSVNTISLENVSHAKAVEILKNATGAVSLTVVSWPGTIV